MDSSAGTSPVVVVTVAALYLAACLAIGMWPSKKTSDSAAGYVAGDRAFGLLVMYFITGATIFSAFAFLGGPGRAYARGGASYYVLAYGILGFLPFYFTGPRAARLGRRYGFVTQAEMVAHRFRSPAIAALMAIISVLAFVPYLGLQMKGAGFVTEMMTRGAVPEWAGALIVYGVVTTYVLKSGVLGVGWTNVFQGVFMMVLAWVLGLYLPYRLYGGVGEMFRQIEDARPGFVLAPGLTGSGEAWTWGEYSSAIVVSIIGFSCWPHLFMKAFTAKRERTLRQTVVLYPTFKIFLVPILMIGFSGVLFPTAPETPGEILPFLLMNLDLPAVVVGLFCAGALAASMSSGDTMSHATASIVVRDGMMSALGRDLDEHAQRALIRVVLVLVMIAAYVVAILSDASLVDLLLKYSYGPIVQFAPPLFAALYLRRASSRAVLGGLLAGILVNSLFLYGPGLRPWDLHAGLYGLAANVVVLALAIAVAPHEPDAEEAEFLDVASTPAP
jgi:SSS family solute:Na+ symporter